ncbi:hypothetical protein EJ05DRAFT_530807 [Pseudovirgaria hyperparasitica]|uniref:Uncharacterized protein n=1 Tax=Pseudovirgaria hyperparasitica TaxID=470096 RepID=A0A6A6WEM4_9PEZI|nr:uncharacterized protein EJ05DRAFT_530807 [Pseudovirgaria hyperparasitica]KAF2761272.1 hypothetical protein EJ05DRAFT_530807 [Pseudovirgaria hyperparasitica]
MFAMLPFYSTCDECSLKTSRQKFISLTFKSLPFLLTFLVVAIVVYTRLFPLLAGRDEPVKERRDSLPTHSKSFGEKSSHWTSRFSTSAKRIAGVTFATNIALSAVLIELLLCEISDALNPAARSLALRVTVPLLLYLLILVTPALEFHSIISAAGYGFVNAKKGNRRVAWLLQLLALTAWLVGFWYLGRGLLGSYLHEKSYVRQHSFSEGCLERIGVIGIALMASLAGFAAVSSIWQSFGIKSRIVTEADIARKQAGLEATTEMLDTKQSRLRALQRKVTEVPNTGIMNRVFTTISGNPEGQERSALHMEVSGLETMQRSLKHSLATLKNRRQEQQRAKTALGRFLNLVQYIFALYCMYRLGATTLATVRRFRSPDTTFSNSDPVNNILALLAKHWDPKLDRAAWSRQISFLLSGVMLLASFNAVLQTFLLFARFLPGVLQHAQANLALIVSQVAATYVISSTLLLRSNLPREMSTVISDALGAPLEPKFVERWFEGWFLTIAAATALGIWISRKMRSVEWDDDYGGTDVEMGKMN